MENDGEDDIVIADPSSKFNLSKGHLPNYDRKLTSHDKSYIELPDGSNSGSIVKEGYTSPIKLDTKYKTGEIKLVKLEVNSKTGEGKLVPLEVDKITGNPKLVTLDINQKTGEAHIVKLEVDEKIGKSKLVGLDVQKLTGESKIVGLEVDNKSSNPKIIELEVDKKTKEGKLVPLDVDIKEGKGKVILLEIKSKSSNPKIVKLDVDEILPKSKMIVLDVSNKTADPKIVNLDVTPITGKEKLVGLNVDLITGEPKLISLDVDEKSSSPILVKLDVNPITGESKLIKLSNYMDTGASLKKGNGTYRENPGSPELVELNVDSKTGSPKLVELNVPEVTGQSKLVMLKVDQKSGEPKIVNLDVTPITGSPKLVLLEVNPVIGQAKIIKLDVPKIEGESKLVMLEVDQKSGEPKIVILEVDPKTGDPKLVKLQVDKKTGKVTLIKLEVQEKEGKKVLVPLSVDEKIGEADFIVLPDNEGGKVDESKYTNYIPGTDIPMHQVSPLVKSYVKDDPMGRPVLTEEAKAKYEATAAWMGIPGLAGIKAAQDYEDIMDIYSRLGEAGKRMQSYITASVAGSGGDNFIPPMPEHDQKGGILKNSAMMSTANGLIRGAVGSMGGSISKISSVALGALTGSSIISLIKNIKGSKGESKANAISKALQGINTAWIKIQTESSTFPGKLPGTGSSVLTDVLNGNIGSAAKSILGNVLDTSSTANPLNVPSSDKNGIFEAMSSDDISDPKGKSSGGLLSKVVGSILGSKSGKGEAQWTNGTKTVKWSDRFSLSIPMSNLVITELMNISNADQLDLSGLRKELNNNRGSVITNYKNNVTNNPLGEIGLDSNHIWEMTLEPLIDSALNDGFTYLPSIDVINKQNSESYNIKSAYGRWLPFTGFELQSAKLTNKSLSLFDGDISYPVSMEFTNEIRVTIADDAVKSFRRYFELATECSVYRSKEYTDFSPSDPKIDKNYMEIAMYKNVTFALTIYVMTYGYICVKKFPLLVTLKDFQVEYSGEIDSGPTELALNFSIVGDNIVDEALKSDHSSGTKIDPSDSRSRYGDTYAAGKVMTEQEAMKASLNNSSLNSTTPAPITKLEVNLNEDLEEAPLPS
jgi:hypothetical protein